MCVCEAERYTGRELTNIADVFVASLTEAGNDLSHWRAYGGQGGGYCIGLRLPSFQGLADNPDAKLGVALERVVYDAADMKARVESGFRPILDRFDELLAGAPQDEEHVDELAKMGMRLLLQQAGMLVTRYKDPAFAVEKEWRIVAMTPREPQSGVIQFHTRPTGLAPFVNVDLFLKEGDPLDVSAVYVGPTQDADRGVHAARLLLADLKYDGALVKPSGIPLRW